MKLTRDVLVTEVSEVLKNVLIHQRHRWGILDAHRRQYEGWWKAECALAIENWAWVRRPPDELVAFAVEPKPSDYSPCGVRLNDQSRGTPDRHAADLLVGPWSDEVGGVSLDRGPRVWIELKVRGTWWSGGVPKLLAGLYSDLEKWRVDGDDDAVLICHITSTEAGWDEPFSDDLVRALNECGPIQTTIVGYEIPRREKRHEGINGEIYRWARMDCFVRSGRK
jgi:hypothetical protein